MHRLLKLSNVTLNHFSVVSRSNIINNTEIRQHSCALCKQYYVFLGNSVRHQSTFTNPILHMNTKRKRVKKAKNYAEILEVRGQATKEARASVRKLNPSDLKILAQEPEIGLGELHKIKTRSRFISNNPVDPTLTTVDADDVDHSEHMELVHENNLIASGGSELSELMDAHEQEELSELAEESTVMTQKQREKSGKEEALTRILGAHIEMCVAIENPARGLSALQYYRNRYKKGKGIVVQSINIYNTLLHGFAMKGNIGKIKEILSYMREDGFQPDVQSFVSIFECLARLPEHNSRTKHIRHFCKELSAQGLTFDELMNEGSFVRRQREQVLSVLQAVEPGYQPTYRPPAVHYTCALLDKLNTDGGTESGDAEVRATDGLFTSEQLKELTRQQLDIEIKGYVKVRSIESKPRPSEAVMQYRQVLQALTADWEDVAAQAFQRGLDTLKAQPRQGSKTLALDPYLRCLPVDDYVRVIMAEVRRLAEGSETYSPTTMQLYRELGARVYARYQVHRKARDAVLDEVCHVQDQYCAWYAGRRAGPGPGPLNPRQRWQWLAHEHRDGASVHGRFHHPWPATTLVAVGEFLYKIIMHDFKVDVNIIKLNVSKKKFLPAFYSLFRSQGRVVKEEVKPHPVLARLFRASEQEFLTFPAHEVPMRCPPRPWTSVTSGGYLVAHADVVRLPVQAAQQWQRLHAAAPGSLYPALDSLNQLAAVPWAVNQPVLDVILEVFNSGGSARLDVPQPPSACPAPPAAAATASKAERFQAFRQRLQARRRRGEMYSLWCDALYRLSLANHFRDDVFWLPHNMDFRGRVYPVPPHLNHLGSDLARSMLVFAESQPLGPRGLDWLKVHAVNLTGLKKRESLAGRLRYADLVLDDILDSADRPLTGRMWWASADEPWQTLACCMEIARAVRSPDPSRYESRFPVHQDGSCNGLQHYAALGRDAAGAASVNLVPADAPRDVYSAVAALVEERRAQDAAAGGRVAQTLAGFVRRKVIKQTVMTTVYGVTRFGARLQIARQLKDLDDFPKDMVWPASTYLTARTFDSLRSMFTSTREIQDWLTECARLIAAVNAQNVEWVTPLGLPVVQPYSRHRKVENARRPLPQNFLMDMYERPNVMKQKNAFPPNFIHSLDSSHMMLTSLHCERAGITFVSVHDCFWTHPCSVHIMNKICREQFVALHSEPILEDLSKFLVKKYSHKNRSIDGSVADITKRKLNKVLQNLPAKGDFDLSTVLDSVYFFS